MRKTDHKQTDHRQLFRQLDDNEKLVYRFVSLYQKILSQKKEYLGESLTPVEMHTLSEIDYNPGVTVTQMAKHWFRTPGAISQTIHKLEKRGLLSREIEPENNRIYHLYVTERGRQISDIHKEQDIQILEKLHDTLGERFSQEQMHDFYEIIKAYTGFLVEQQDDETNRE